MRVVDLVLPNSIRFGGLVLVVLVAGGVEGIFASVVGWLVSCVAKVH